MKKKKVLFLFLFLATGVSFAQQGVVVKEESRNSSIVFEKSVLFYEPFHNVDATNNDLYLGRYDKKTSKTLFLVDYITPTSFETLTLTKIPEAQYVFGTVFADQLWTFYVLKGKNKKSSDVFVLNRTATGTNSTLWQPQTLSVLNRDIWVDRVNINVCSSPNNEFLSLAWHEINESNNTFLTHVCVWNRAGELITDKVLSGSDFLAFSKACYFSIDNRGVIHALFHNKGDEDRKTDTRPSITYVTLDANGVNVYPLKLDEAAEIPSVKGLLLRNGQFLVAGYLTQDEKRPASTLFYARFDHETQEFGDVIMEEVSEDDVTFPKIPAYQRHEIFITMNCLTENPDGVVSMLGEVSAWVYQCMKNYCFYSYYWGDITIHTLDESDQLSLITYPKNHGSTNVFSYTYKLHYGFNYIPFFKNKQLHLVFAIRENGEKKDNPWFYPESTSASGKIVHLKVNPDDRSVETSSVLTAGKSTGFRSILSFTNNGLYYLNGDNSICYLSFEELE